MLRRTQHTQGPCELHGRQEMFLVGFGLVWFSLSSGTSREWKKANPESGVSRIRGSGRRGGGTKGRGRREPPVLVEMAWIWGCLPVRTDCLFGNESDS